MSTSGLTNGIAGSHIFFVVVLKPIQLLFYIIEFRQFCLTAVRTGEGSLQNAEGILEFCCE